MTAPEKRINIDKGSARGKGAAGSSRGRGSPGRGSVDGLGTAHPIGHMLPGVYLEDDFAQRWTQGLDDVIAPIFLALDCLEAYVDPKVTPPDFLDWLAQWVGEDLDENWPEDRRRAVITEASGVQPWRGTARGVAEFVRLATGHEAEVIDSGGAAYSVEPHAEPPGSDSPTVIVRIRSAEPDTVNQAQVLAAAREACPITTAVQVEVVSDRGGR